jgi:hypothetical protein
VRESVGGTVLRAPLLPLASQPPPLPPPSQVSRVVFGSDDDPLYKRFMVMIDSSMIGATGSGKGESPKIEVRPTSLATPLFCSWHARAV